MNVIFEDNHLLVVDKPAGMATMGTAAGTPSVHRWACDYLKRRYQKPGNVFVGVVSRLDRVTTGVLVLARTSKAAARLSIQFGGPGKSKKVSQQAQKLYLAMVDGDLLCDGKFSASGELSDAVWKDDGAHRMRVDRTGRSDSQPARLQYCVIDNRPTRTLLAVRLLTGRKHQIRLQFADRGHPIMGDQKYGSETDFFDSIALHSWQLSIGHPTQMTALNFKAPIPANWNRVSAPIPDQAIIETRLAQTYDWHGPDTALDR
ncbi:RNA pseudouridine synthase [Stieleria sp. TO1_6]|uniref:RluA family pseudouridine synthase n=1 Tax=Stieleria tagensis TaxID=2956795 RepID=UPI00209AC7D2|nr:RNA pseudouridine synthase [Stieleria tagensis]MCO8122266.1 RNA pseudouridine synthase [Stieleria tagensis]